MPARLVEFGTLPLSFQPNRGQIAASLDYYAQGPGYGVSLSASSLTLALIQGSASSPRDGEPPELGPMHISRTARDVRNEQIQINLKGASKTSRSTGVDEQTGRSHYFQGSDPKKWLTNIPTFAKVRYQDVYPGIDVVYYGNPEHLEYDFIISPGADPRQIRFDLKGEESSLIDRSGNLVIRLKGGAEVTLHRPRAFQRATSGRHLDVPARFQKVDNHTYAFTLGSYLSDRELIIDPYVVYSTALKGSSFNGRAIAVDASGCAYVTGPAARFPADFTHGTDSSAGIFVVKIDPTGSRVVYSVFIAGSSLTEVSDIKVDSQGAAYVVGWTYSVDFPVTPEAVQPRISGLANGFVLKLGPSGDALLWSTFVGGSNADGITGLTLDDAGQIYLAGFTSSSDFPKVNSTPEVPRRGLVRSTDGGVTWETNKPEVVTGVVSDVAVHPSVPGLIYAATEAGLFRSTDDGQTWSRIEALGREILKKVSIAPNGMVYAYGYGSTLHRGNSSGDSWTAIQVPIIYVSSAFSDLAFDPVSPQTIYLACEDGLRRTKNGGQTWSKIGLSEHGDQGTYSVAVNQSNPLEIYVSETNFIWRSQDGGQTWSSVWGSASDILMDPVSPSTLYVVNRMGGLQISKDSGATWVYPGVLARWLEISSKDSRTLYAGGYGNSGLLRSTDGGGNWTPISWPGFRVNCARVSDDGHLQVALDHHVDLAFSVLQSDGSRFLYSSVAGGPGRDYATDIKRDRFGNTYLGGSASAGFPFTIGGQPSTGTYGFVLKMNQAFDVLWATGIGSSGQVTGEALAVGEDGTAVLVGQTGTDFPGPLAVLGPSKMRNAFATKVDTESGAIQSSAVFGGSRDDIASAVAIDHLGRIHVTGGSDGDTFPVTDAAWSQNGYGGSNAYYAILHPQLDSLEYSLLFPSAKGYGVVLGSDESAFLTGQLTGRPTPGFGLEHSCLLNSPSLPLTSSALIVKISPGKEVAPSLQPSSLLFRNRSGTTVVRVVVPAHAEWRASTDSSWIAVSPSVGCGPGFITVTYARMEGTIGASRRAEITVGNLKLPVTQEVVRPRSPRSGPSR